MNNNSELYKVKAIPASEIDRFYIGFIFTFLTFFGTFAYTKFGTNSAVRNSFLYLVTGFLIITGLFTYAWDTDRVVVEDVKYTPALNGTIKAEIKLSIGLQGFNVTLYGIPETQLSNGIRYNEHFSWSMPVWRHRVLRDSLENAIYRGVPLPILSVAEPMVIDAEYIRWGREYRIAGYYTYIFLWLGFSFWALSLFVFSVLRNKSLAGFIQVLSGLSLLLGWNLWLILKPYTFLVPFSKETVLSLKLGYSFIVTVIVSVLSVVHGIVQLR